MTLNGLIAGIVGAKVDPTIFSLWAFANPDAALELDVVAVHEAHLDRAFGIVARSADEAKLDALLLVH